MSTLVGGFSDAVSAEVRGDLETLGAFERAALEELAEIVIRLIIVPVDGVRSAAVAAEVKAFAAARSVKNAAALQSGVRGLVALLQPAARRGTSSEELARFAAASGLAEPQAAVLAALWEKRLVAPAGGGGALAGAGAVDDDDDDDDDDDAALPGAETLRRLVDLEWKFGVTAASSESGAAHAGKTFLQLKLVLDAPGGGLEAVYLELTLNQFYEFLAHMERARAALANVAAAA